VVRDRKRRRRRMAPGSDRRSAFTLIELLLVLVILSVLAAIAVPRFTGHSKEARITAARLEIRNIETALDMFEISAGRYPTSDEGLLALVEQPSGVENWRPAFEHGVPDDPWGNVYAYRCPGQHNTIGFDLYSLGPDGQEGTDDDIDNWSTR
jgi:general secretion pathway protein G